MKLLEVMNKSNLPDQVVEAFLELGAMQRGKPEQVMVRLQHAMGGGVLNPVVEHTGDLTHRMTHDINFGYAGRDLIYDKAEKVLRWLRRSYGFEREFEENIKNNAEYFDLDVEEYRKKIYNLLKQYAKEHSKLPAYNRLQWWAREAAVSVGERDWTSAIRLLGRLKETAEDQELYEKMAREYELDSNGNLKQYRS